MSIIADRQAQMQAARIQRARSEQFRFRLVTIKTSAGPISAVYVTSGANVYTVSPGKHGERCCCGDYTRRCAGTTLACKHIVAVRDWLANGTTLETEPESAGDRAAQEAKRAQTLAERALWD
jgi:hypothetical protein